MTHKKLGTTAKSFGNGYKFAVSRKGANTSLGSSLFVTAQSRAVANRNLRIRRCFRPYILYKMGALAAPLSLAKFLAN